jgi:predicted O-methyltransferase YrrM
MINALLGNLAISHSRPLNYIAPEQMLPLYDVTAHATHFDLTPLERLSWAPAWLTGSERLLLYALIFALRPERYLEIGTLHGGSALVVAAAMEAAKTDGQIFCVDPEPQIVGEHWRLLQQRTTLIKGFSPGALAEAYTQSTKPFNFVLIDGDHSSHGVLGDANGALPFMASGAYMIFHDAFHFDTQRGIRNFIAQHSTHVIDCGIISREMTIEKKRSNQRINDKENDLMRSTQVNVDSNRWCGLWLLRVTN